MRGIKFRAWDNASKKMLPVTALFWNTLEWYVSRAEFNGNYNNTDFILMQFTGLKDKDGKDIYERDIVEYENNNSGYGLPRDREISRDVIPSLLEHMEYVGYESWWESGRVIGNTCENGDLLK